MKLLLLALVSLLVISSSSCYKVYCTVPSLSLSWSGFDTSDFALVVINKCRKDGTFSNVQSRRVYIRTFDSTKSTPDADWDKSDTVYYYQAVVGLGVSIDANYDYSIVFPSRGHTYKITGIAFGNESTSVGNNHGCTKSASWYVDGQKKTYAGYYFWDEFTTIEIKK